MITEKKVVLYEKYNGLLDAYVFENGNLPNADFDLMDWSLIDELIGNIILISSKKASTDFEKQLISFVERNTESKMVINRLQKLAKIKNS